MFNFKEMASIVAPGLKGATKPDLISIINGFEGDVEDAVFIADQSCILTSSDERYGTILCEFSLSRSLRLWVMRESGRYWPSVAIVLPSMRFTCAFTLCI